MRYEYLSTPDMPCDLTLCVLSEGGSNGVKLLGRWRVMVINFVVLDLRDLHLFLPLEAPKRHLSCISLLLLMMIVCNEAGIFDQLWKLLFGDDLIRKKAFH